MNPIRIVHLIAILRSQDEARCAWVCLCSAILRSWGAIVCTRNIHYPTWNNESGSNAVLIVRLFSVPSSVMEEMDDSGGCVTGEYWTENLNFILKCVQNLVYKLPHRHNCLVHPYSLFLSIHFSPFNLFLFLSLALCRSVVLSLTVFPVLFHSNWIEINFNFNSLCFRSTPVAACGVDANGKFPIPLVRWLNLLLRFVFSVFCIALTDAVWPLSTSMHH